MTRRDRHWMHRRGLVINIGGQKFGSQILGGQKFWENIFSDNIVKKFEKIPFYFLTFLRTFFSQQQLFFEKLTPFIQNVLPFLCIFLSFFVSVSAFFHVLFFLNKTNYKFSSDYWGSKNGFCPLILIIGG